MPNPSFGAVRFGFGPFGGTDQPVFTDEVAFASDPFASPQVYTDVTAFVKQRSVRMGRQSRADRPETGRSVTVLGDTERRFDPENVAGPYYPNVLPMRRIRCRAALLGVTYDVFSTFVDTEQGWQIQQVAPGYAEVVAAGNDGFDVLGTHQFSATDSFPLQIAGVRINAILDLVGWPAAERDIDTTSGQSNQQAAVAGSLAGADALSVILDAAETEDGIFYIDGRGYAIFKGRHRQTDTRYSVSQATFCDRPNYAPGRLLYASITPASSRILNDIRVTRAGGAEQAAADAASILRYRRRTQTLATNHTTDAEALSFAQFLLASSKDPHRRYDEMTIKPLADPDLWLQVLARQIGDRITVIWTPPGGGTPSQADAHIEARSIDIGPGVEATCVWRLSPADAFRGWLLGDPTYSLLGQTTTLTY